jgi:signal transduction histidine kinase
MDTHLPNSLSDDDRLQRLLDRTLSAVRWLILAGLLLITVLWPFSSRTGYPLWILVLGAIAYNLLAEGLRRYVPAMRSYARIAILDLLVAAIVFYFDYEPNGPMFIMFYIGLISATLTMEMRGASVYLMLVVGIVASFSPTLPGWSASNEDLRQLSARLIIFAVVGTGASALVRRLKLEVASATESREAAVRLQELGEIRSEFISTVSHDLRTPLTAARAGLGLLAMRTVEDHDPDNHLLLANAQRNVERLGILIDDLLMYNQLESGIVQLDRENVDLRLIVTEALSSVQPLIQEKGQVLEVELRDPLPGVVDPRRFEQVIVNLLSNAHRHTPEGTRIAVIGCANTDEVLLTVRDTGPGIPPDELEEVFLRFHRLTTMNGSSGLGLAIAKSMVELHQGRIWADSIEGHGAAFTVALPLRRMDEQVAAEDSDR